MSGHHGRDRSIAEDEPVIARRLERLSRAILQDRLEAVRSARSLAAAQALVPEQMIDVLLLDLDLEGADGMALLREAAAGSFQTIIISANVDRALDAFLYGVFDFVSKPFTEERPAQAFARLTSLSADR